MPFYLKPYFNRKDKSSGLSCCNMVEARNFSLPGSALRTHAESLGKPRNVITSTSVLEACPGKLDIKRHSPSILYILCCCSFIQETTFRIFATK